MVSGSMCSGCIEIKEKVHIIQSIFVNIPLYNFDKDIDKNILNYYNIESLPTFLIFNNSELLLKIQSHKIYNIISSISICLLCFYDNDKNNKRKRENED